MTSSSPAELNRIERFIAAYNALDQFLQAQTGVNSSFRSAVDYFAKRNLWWSDAETLRGFAQLRNFLVHEKTRPFDYPCAPSEGATLEIEAIAHNLLHPQRLRDRFARVVWLLESEQTLHEALLLMAQKEVSRFPVFRGAQFVGLLSENGIARFLAARTLEGNFSDLSPISHVLKSQSGRPTYRFATPDTSVQEAVFWFRENIFLEAIFLSPNGRQSRDLKGVVTRGDVV